MSLTATQLASQLECIYDPYDYSLINNREKNCFDLEIIDQVSEEDTTLYLVKYTLNGNLKMMPGFLTHIDSITTKEIRENLTVIYDSEFDEVLAKFNIPEKLRSLIENGLFIIHSKGVNLRTEFFSNVIEEKLTNVTAEFYNVVISDQGLISFLFENNSITPAWKR